MNDKYPNAPLCPECGFRQRPLFTGWVCPKCRARVISTGLSDRLIECGLTDGEFELLKSLWKLTRRTTRKVTHP